MRFTILYVGHGFFAYLVADNGNVILFDCGISASEGDIADSEVFFRLLEEEAA